MDSINTISIKGLYGGYGLNNILKNINIDIPRASFTAITGPNGSGKSTLLKHLINELVPKKGIIEIDGININEFKRSTLAEKVSYLGQQSYLNEEFTVEELIEFGRFCHKEKKDKNILKQVMETTGIIHLKNKLVTQISGGELQLAMFARCLCQQTNIILLDEPSNNLDLKHQLLLMKCIEKCVLDGKTVIAVIHDLNLIMQYCSNTILLKDGAVYDKGPTEKVLNKRNIKEVFGVDGSIIPAHDRIPSTFYYSL